MDLFCFFLRGVWLLWGNLLFFDFDHLSGLFFDAVLVGRICFFI